MTTGSGAALAAAVERVATQLGRVEVVVDNAGFGGTAARLADGDVAFVSGRYELAELLVRRWSEHRCHRRR